MYYHPKRLPANEDRIFKQRQYEDTLRSRLESLHEYEKLMSRAKFERVNEPRMSCRSLTEKLEEIGKEREDLLSARRRKLKKLMEDEEYALEEELKTCNMNLAERRAWLENQARIMKMERLKNDEKYAESQLARAFRMNSDDVRIHNSKLAVMKAEEERKRQRQMNAFRKIQEQEDEKYFNKMMELEWEKQDDLCHRELENEKASKREAADILREQLAMVQRLREEEREAIEEDMRNMTRRWHEEEEALKQSQHEKRATDLKKAKELLEHNEQCRTKKLTELHEQKNYDARMIAMVAETEAAEELQEKQLKEAQKREAIAYASQLKDVMAKKRAEDAELEAMIQNELEEVWHKQDSISLCQEEARKRLYDRVHEERQAQIRLNELKRESAEQDRRSQHEKHLQEAKNLQLEEQTGKEQTRMTKQELMEALESQIRIKQAVEIITQEAKRIEHEGTKVVEKNYEAKVKEAISLHNYPEPWYGRKAVKWYE